MSSGEEDHLLSKLNGKQKSKKGEGDSQPAKKTKKDGVIGEEKQNRVQKPSAKAQGCGGENGQSTLPS